MGCHRQPGIRERANKRSEGGGKEVREEVNNRQNSGKVFRNERKEKGKSTDT